MGKLALEITEEPIIGNAGLAAMGELMRISDIDSTCAKRESPNYHVAEKDILRCLGGLIGIGKVGFDHVRQFKNSDFFATALGLGRVPSEATLRQRFEAMSLDHDVHDAMPMCSVRMLRKLDFKPRHVSVPHFVGVRIDTDSTILDNSDTKKEGIAKGYNGVLGYAPVCSFLEGGLIVGAKLCPGSHHPLHEGALDVHAGVRSRVRKLTKSRLLWVDDAAFDDAALMTARTQAGDSFITRHNLRREKPEILINLAMQEGQGHSPRPGKTVYTGCTSRDREGIGTVRLVYRSDREDQQKGTDPAVAGVQSLQRLDKSREGVRCRHPAFVPRPGHVRAVLRGAEKRTRPGTSSVRKVPRQRVVLPARGPGKQHAARSGRVASRLRDYWAEEGNAPPVAHHYAGDDVLGRTIRPACAACCREGGVQRRLR